MKLKRRAIKIVNDTEYGLGNFLQTEDKEKAKRVSRKLNAGIIYVNGIGPDSGTPFGGFKQSGNGREGGVMGFRRIFRSQNSNRLVKIRMIGYVMVGTNDLNKSIYILRYSARLIGSKKS